MFRPSHRALAVIWLAILLVVPTLAQAPAPPDLSGTWKLDLMRSKLAKGSQIQSETLVIAYSNDNIQFRYTESAGRDATMTYTIDGREHVIKEIPLRHSPTGAQLCPHETPQSEQIYTLAQWKKSELTAELHFRVPGPCYPPRNDACPCDNDSTLSGDRWSLSPDGRVLFRTSEAVQSTDAYYPKQTFVYDKQ